MRKIFPALFVASTLCLALGGCGAKTDNQARADSGATTSSVSQTKSATYKSATFDVPQGWTEAAFGNTDCPPSGDKLLIVGTRPEGGYKGRCAATPAGANVIEVHELGAAHAGEAVTIAKSSANKFTNADGSRTFQFTDRGIEIGATLDVSNETLQKFLDSVRFN